MTDECCQFSGVAHCRRRVCKSVRRGSFAVVDFVGLCGIVVGDAFEALRRAKKESAMLCF